MPRSLLINIRTPPSIELCSTLPSSLNGNVVGGFHPCGMWDYITDSAWQEWCGIQFYLSHDDALQLTSANPRMDKSLIRVISLSEAQCPTDVVETCKENGTSHFLQILWGQLTKPEIIPALEFTDSWYASSPFGCKFDDTRFSAAQEFFALGIMDVDSKMVQYGLRIPQRLTVPYKLES